MQPFSDSYQGYVRLQGIVQQGPLPVPQMQHPGFVSPRPNVGQGSNPFFMHKQHPQVPQRSTLPVQHTSSQNYNPPATLQLYQAQTPNSRSNGPQQHAATLKVLNHAARSHEQKFENGDFRLRRGGADSPFTSSTADSSENRGDNDKTSSRDKTPRSDENHTPPSTPPGVSKAAEVAKNIEKCGLGAPEVIVLPAYPPTPPTPPLSSDSEEDSKSYHSSMEVNLPSHEPSMQKRQMTPKAQLAQQAIGSTPTLVQAAETARQHALATAEAMAERRRCGAAGPPASQRRNKHQSMAQRSRSLNVAKNTDEATSEQTTVRAASVERSAVLEDDFRSKGVPGIWDSALKLIHSAKIGKEVKEAGDAAASSATPPSQPSTSMPETLSQLRVDLMKSLQPSEPTKFSAVRSKALAKYRHKDKVLGMLKEVQSDFRRLEAETKTSESQQEVSSKACTRESHAAASSAKRENSFERWRRELRAQAGLGESDLDHSLQNVQRDALAGTI